jgi:hypothetical protein
MPLPKPGFTALAISLGAATGNGTSVMTDTFTAVASGLFSTASAFAVTAAQSPPGGTPPATAVLVHASATGGNLNINSSFSTGAIGNGFNFQAAGNDSSSFNLFDYYSTANAPLT